MSFLDRIEDWLLNPKRKKDRLKTCVWVLEIGTILSCFLDKILTYLAVTTLGAVELNPVAKFLGDSLGLIPACILGFVANILPLVLIHMGIRKFKWDTMGHYWLYAIFLASYFVLFFEVVKSQISAFL